MARFGDGRQRQWHYRRCSARLGHLARQAYGYADVYQQRARLSDRTLRAKAGAVMSDCDEIGCQNYARPGHQFCDWHERNPRKATNTNQAPGDSRQGTAPLWDNDAMLARCKQAFGANPDVHLWAFMCWMRDDLNADRQRLAKEVAELQAQLTRAGWEWAAAEDTLDRIREKLRDMPQTFDDLGRHMYGDR